MARLLKFNPRERPTAEEVLKMELFDDIREPSSDQVAEKKSKKIKIPGDNYLAPPMLVTEMDLIDKFKMMILKES